MMIRMFGGLRLAVALFLGGMLSHAAQAGDRVFDALAIEPAAAEPELSLLAVYAEIGRDRSSLGSVGGSAPRLLETDFGRLGADFQWGDEVVLGGYLDVRNTGGHIGTGFGRLAVDATGAAITVYGAWRVRPWLAVGAEALYANDSGSLTSPFGTVAVSLDGANVKPFVLGFVPVGPAVLQLGAAVNLSRFRLRIAGAPTEFLNFTEIEAGALLRFPILGSVSGELGGDLLVVTREDILLGGARTDTVTARFTATLELEIGDHARLKLEGQRRAFDGDLDETSVTLRMEYRF